jgi:eukaryotic-like serine/threonine-protein kinase
VLASTRTVIGKYINNYQVVSLLGEGGMGTVYLAIHPIMGRKAAVKVLKPDLANDESLVRRFFNEARAATAIRHPNIIDIIDVGMLPEGNVPYMLMELLEGESLSARLGRAGRLTVDAAIEVVVQTASALEAAHSMGVVPAQSERQPDVVGKRTQKPQPTKKASSAPPNTVGKKWPEESGSRRAKFWW